MASEKKPNLSGQQSPQAVLTTRQQTALFSFILFLSASLMFMVQPMIGKMMLPLVGGAPSGWLVAVAFFQMALLAGYGLAYILSRLTAQKHVFAVLVLLLTGLAVLPLKLEISDNSLVTPSPHQVLILLTTSVFLPFFALSTVSSSLQRFFSTVTAKDVPDPYFLFAASNLGSFAGLLIYPLWIERVSGLTMQSGGWRIGYMALIAVIALCLLINRNAKAIPVKIATDAAITTRWRQRGYWVILAAIPSSLLLGVTAYITVDQGSLPLFWVVPLALYLLTFIIAFAKHQFIKLRVLSFAQIASVLIFIFVFLQNPFSNNNIKIYIVLPVCAFFLTALFCHFLLAADRPTTRKLTEYYFWVAAGGALGGCFNAFLVPYLFPLPLEFILVATASCLLHVSPRKKPTKNWVARTGFTVLFLMTIGALVLWGSADRDKELIGQNLLPFEFFFIGLICCLFHPAWLARQTWFTHKSPKTRVYIGLAVLVVLSAAIEISIVARSPTPEQMPATAAKLFLLIALVLFGFRPRLLAVVAPVLGAIAILTHTGPHLLDVKRNFFGVWRVYEQTSQDTVRHILYHGTTIHGTETVSPRIDTRPNSYYASLSDIIRPDNDPDIGLVGLGAGIVVCYQAPNRHFTVYEVDRDVVAIATKWFDYFRQCGTPVIHIGDGRRLLAQAKDAHHDLLVIDAFSSDSIPLHLLTKEAFETYFERLTPDGLLALHISNRYYDLRQPISNIAQALSLHGVYKSFASSEGDSSRIIYANDWVVVARSEAALAPLRTEHWVDLPPSTSRPWTDDFSDALSALDVSSLYK